MARKRATTGGTRAAQDRIAALMSALLTIHSAKNVDWLVDAASTAAERTLNAPYTLFYLDDDGCLAHRRPASDLRRRSLQVPIDAFGKDVLRSRMDPARALGIAAALQAPSPQAQPVATLFAGLADEDTLDRAARAVGVVSAAAAPLAIDSERLGALILLFAEEPPSEHVRIFAEHVARAASNLRQAEAAREHGVIDVVRSVFDARKLESELEKELARASRYRHGVSIAVIEATNLRLLRERFGSFLTDRMLERLGAALARNSRDIDVIGAYKESGYTMILTEANAPGASAAASRLLETADEHALDADAVPGLELHLVSGWASYPADGASAEALFAAAERRMYDPASQVA